MGYIDTGFDRGLAVEPKALNVFSTDGKKNASFGFGSQHGLVVMPSLGSHCKYVRLMTES